MAPVQRGAGLYLSGQPLDHEPSLGQVPVVSLAGAASPPSDAWLPPSTHQFSRLRYGAPPGMAPPPPGLDRGQSPGAMAAAAAAVMHGIPLPPAVPPGALGGPPYPGDMGCDPDVLQYQQPGSTQNSAAGRVEVF